MAFLALLALYYLKLRIMSNRFGSRANGSSFMRLIIACEKRSLTTTQLSPFTSLETADLFEDSELESLLLYTSFEQTPPLLVYQIILPWRNSGSTDPKATLKNSSWYGSALDNRNRTRRVLQRITAPILNSLSRIVPYWAWAISGSLEHQSTDSIDLLRQSESSAMLNSKSRNWFGPH